MTDTPAATQYLTATVAEPAEPNPRSNRPRGGRGGRGGRQEAGQHFRPEQGQGQRGRPRGGYRGSRGSRSENNASYNSRGAVNSATEPETLKPPPLPDLGGGGTFGTRLTEDARKEVGEGTTKEKVEAADAEEAETEAKFVIFTDDAVKKYEDFDDNSFGQVDDVLGIKYENQEINEDTRLLLRYNCPDADCDIACYGWPDLHRHVRSVHHKQMCDLCTRNKKVFTHEHELFTTQELRKHEKFGDDHPGAIDQSGFRGHPECGFCRERFYGDDELYTHCRDKHERCHICDRRNQGRQQQYYQDYDALEVHFRKDHFLCYDRECLEKKFVVFESEIDLKAHQLQTHPNDLSKDARRDARLVDMSSFDYRAPYRESRGRGDREGRGRGRGRDPNTDPIPQSTAQPLRRDELAFQRQMAIQSAQSTAPRTFGGQLTATSTPATVTATRNSNPPNPSFPAIDSLNLNSVARPTTTPFNPTSSTAQPEPVLTAQEQARRVQHQAVIQRASQMLNNDPLKIEDFRSRVSSYRSSTITASQLLDTFFSLFDVPAARLGTLVRELAEIYESEQKRKDLLAAWNGWRAINEDYPSLPGPSGVLPGFSATATGSGGRRILKLKSSTAQSSRSAVSKQGSWGNATVVTPPSRPLPSTASTASTTRPGPGHGKTPTTTPWLASSSRSTPSTSRTASVAPLRGSDSSDAFPALPAAAKPNTTIFGLHRGSVKWDDRSTPPNNPWGGANGVGSSSVVGSANASAVQSEAEGEEGGGKKKGNKGKKQTLYRFG